MRPTAIGWIGLCGAALSLLGCDAPAGQRAGTASDGWLVADSGPHDAAGDRERESGTALSCDDELAPWAGGAAYYARWSQGPPADPSFFPVAIWLQDPARNGEAYQAIGVNLFIGLWEGPTAAQLTALADTALHAVAHQNSVGLQSDQAAQIWAWMHQDEPDNAQPAEGGGYDPCVEPATIQEEYAALRAEDSSRPVYLNFGRGVSHEDWGGRGECTGHLEHYPEYIKGADIISFDIYPVTSDDEVAGKLWYVPRGVERLRQWADYQKPVWTWIETTHINNAEQRPTPAQVRAEVWMALIHGAMGIGYFAHEFTPTFVEAGLLSYPEIVEAVGSINAQINELAPVLNSPTVANGVVTRSSDPEVKVATLLKRHGGSTYLFAVAMRDRPTTATFELTCVPPDASVEVLGEQRQLVLGDASFSDAYAGYGVHLYRIDHRR